MTLDPQCFSANQLLNTLSTLKQEADYSTKVCPKIFVPQSIFAIEGCYVNKSILTNITQEKTISAHRKLKIGKKAFSQFKKLLPRIISMLYDDLTSFKKLETNHGLI